LSAAEPPGWPDPESEPLPAAGADQPAMKACPDCAEMVLAAARKCRYCGYRFDGQSDPPAQEGLFAHLMRRSAPRLTMAQTVRQLGVELAPGERPAGLWLGRVKGIDGYVVLTDRRLAFVIGMRHAQGSPKPWQHRLDDLTEAEITGHRRKSALRLHWRDAPDMTIDGLAQKDLERLHAALLERVGS
jgi:Uncharacterised protein family UPF0547